MSVLLKPGSTTTATDLDTLFLRELAPYKRPRWYDIRTEPLPRNTVGKIMKRDLRAAHDPDNHLRLEERS